MNFHFIVADSLQKLVVLFALFLWQFFSTRGSIEWTITLFSLSTIPNTLVVGIPLLGAMYGEQRFSSRNNSLKKQPPSLPSSIHVDSDVTSLRHSEQLQANAEISDVGKLHVVLRRSSTVSSLKSKNMSPTPRASNLTGVDIYSLPSTREPTPRGSISSFNEAESLGRRCINGDLGNLFNQRRHNFATSDTYKSEISSWPDMIPPVTGTVLNDNNSTEVKVEVASEFPGDASPLATNQNEANCEAKEELHEMPPAGVMIRLGLLMVWRKLTTNLNTYACVIGLVWSLISFRWNMEMPSIIKGSITILSNTGLGMAMFSLGLFMGSQPSIVSCGKRLAIFAMVIRFLVGPAVIAATSAAVGLQGTLLQVAILQG
ncbi:hypothetical protein SLEP1_g21754 [Rubroshorea leprosula]|uniref:Auxin efflux carrier component n=1 Tax=Rubroshorea leprosula TaxID=152421 RepID=A0AAV5JG93_9ROSI|nr:hypothetical protein SLEP1_g21754 [Rubroshorea leprosula]